MAHNAIHSVSYALVKTFVRQKLENLKNDPERSTRSLVDMALHFSTGRFQTYFFQVAQTMLENDQSSYYRLIQDVAAHIDTDRLVTFGMNLGYNGLTAGARVIRKERASSGLATPWAVALQVDAASYDADPSAYEDLIAQGEALGIYTWALFAPSQPEVLLPLIRSHGECAFFLFSTPAEITDDFLSAAAPLHNLMLSVEMQPGADRCCSRMRSRQMLYGVHYLSASVQPDAVEDGGILYDAGALHPLMTFFVPPAESMADAQKDALYAAVLSARCRQEFDTIPVDLWGDFHRVDTVICEDACAIIFRPDGSLVPSAKEAPHTPLNFHNTSLREILLRRSGQ